MDLSLKNKKLTKKEINRIRREKEKQIRDNDIIRKGGSYVKSS